MTAPPPVPSSHPAGYLSEDNKKRYTVIVGIFAALFFIGQFVLPMVIWIGAMPFIMSSQMAMMKEVDADGAASWNNSVWYVERSLSTAEGKGKTTLNRLAPDSPEPIAVTNLSLSSPALLADGDTLWAIASDGVAFAGSDGVVQTRDLSTGGDPSPPFLYHGKPSVIERRPDGFMLVSLNENATDWINVAPFTKLAVESDGHWSLSSIKAIGEGDTLHLFFRFCSKLYYQAIVPGQVTDLSSTWETIADSSGKWDASLVDGKPAAFVIDSGNDGPFPRGVAGYFLRDGKWEKDFSAEVAVMGDIGLISSRGASNLTFIAEGMPGQFRIFTVSDGTVTENTRYGESSFPFGKGMMAMMFIPYSFMFLAPFILAFIFSALMRKHRILDHHADGRSARYASLAKRAVSQLIDAAIAGLPAGLGYFMMMSSIFDMERMVTTGSPPWGIFANFALIAIGIPWGLLCFVVFVFCEGKWGTTPGKLAVGIRVIGTDLKPCGFGRALLRGILKFVDGFFSFMVGVMVIALTNEFQRVGDMVARTIVIDVRSRPVKIEA